MLARRTGALLPPRPVTPKHESSAPPPRLPAGRRPLAARSENVVELELHCKRLMPALGSAAAGPSRLVASGRAATSSPGATSPPRRGAESPLPVSTMAASPDGGGVSTPSISGGELWACAATRGTRCSISSVLGNNPRGGHALSCGPGEGVGVGGGSGNAAAAAEDVPLPSSEALSATRRSVCCCTHRVIPSLHSHSRFLPSCAEAMRLPPSLK
jgi:hypothetical protein